LQFSSPLRLAACGARIADAESIITPVVVRRNFAEAGWLSFGS
jgi:hypothetical protein